MLYVLDGITCGDWVFGVVGAVVGLILIAIIITIVIVLCVKKDAKPYAYREHTHPSKAIHRDRRLTGRAVYPGDAFYPQQHL